MKGESSRIIKLNWKYLSLNNYAYDEIVSELMGIFSSDDNDNNINGGYKYMLLNILGTVEYNNTI